MGECILRSDVAATSYELRAPRELVAPRRAYRSHQHRPAQYGLEQVTSGGYFFGGSIKSAVAGDVHSNHTVVCFYMQGGLSAVAEIEAVGEAQNRGKLGCNLAVRQFETPQRLAAIYKQLKGALIDVGLAKE